MGKYLVHARLGCWISRNTLPWYIVAQLVSVQKGETRNYALKAELRMDASQTVKE